MITVQGAKTFREIWPNVPQSQDDAYFRLDWAPPRIGLRSQESRPIWRAASSSGASIPVTADARNPSHATLERPTAASWIDIEDGQSVVRVWFVSSSIEVRSSGPRSSDDPNWPNILSGLRTLYGAPSYQFSQLGLIDFHTSQQSITGTFSGRRFGGMVEVIGRILPMDIRSSGMRFFFARRVTGCSIHHQDEHGARLSGNRDPEMPMRQPGSNDTSPGQTGGLSAAGKLFDYDFPGAVMKTTNRVGDRSVVDVSFEQCVVIGTPPPAGVDPWPRITALGLAVSPLATWRVNYTATVREQASSTHGVVLTLSGGVQGSRF